MSDDQGTTSKPVPVAPPAEPQADPPGEPEEYPVDRLKRRLGRRMGGRPLMVYIVLFAGAATLLLLLAVVWISATNNDGDEPVCTEIAPAEAQSAVLDGQVRRIRVLVDQDQPVETLTGIVLEFKDDACRQTPQGADTRAELFRVLGAVQLYNHFNEEDGVKVTYTQQDIQRELLATSTPAPSETPTALPASPTAVIVVVETPSPTETPAPTATAAATAAASPTAAPRAPSPTP